MSRENSDIQENSLDGSGDGELLSMVNEGSYESDANDKTQLVTHSYLEADGDGPTTFSFKEISGPLTAYKIVSVSPGEEAMTTIVPDSPTPVGQYFVISNPVEVYTPPMQKKIVRRDASKMSVTSRAMVTKKRDDKRRATHNEVERRRRDKINNWITKLARLVPDAGAPDSASKGGILAKACDYITNLTEKQKRFQKMERDNDKLVREIVKLNQELLELRKENSVLRTHLPGYTSKGNMS